MNQIQQASAELHVPSTLDAASSKLVYLSLAETDEATITELADALDMQKLALYSILGSLADQGLVEQCGETYRLAN